jgi:octanoyl-[GcvH]:protein N-octanoyltransferase
MRTLRLLREGFTSPPTLDTAVSHAILRRVSDGLEPATLRLHRPGSIVAFGPKDRHSQGYERAIALAAEWGFGSVQRLAGGRAAVFDEQTIAFSWAIPDASPAERIEERFVELGAIMAAAFRDLGVDARVGEVPGEYCPGQHSVNARGERKLVGVGQRLVARAAHVGGVVVVGGSDRVRDVLVPVYEALGIAWDPATTGSLEDEIPGLEWEEALDAILARFGDMYDLSEGAVSPGTMDLALTLQDRHAVPDPHLTRGLRS